MDARPIDDDAAWEELRGQWELREGTVYLNHGSFGPPPIAVQQARRSWQAELDAQPMDFFVRQLEGHLLNARRRLAEFVGTTAENLILADNATYGMNIVAESIPLSVGDEVVLTDHEYGAVLRVWERACSRTGATLRIVELPKRFESPEQVVATIATALTDKTKLLVVSHITSPTAITLPVKEMCDRARARDVAVCIDGPHAVAQLPLDIDALDCDFYCASCHKWLCAPLGTGFLYVDPRRQADVVPPILSWGKLDTEEGPQSWVDEFGWLGTRDPSGLLTIPTAIEFLEGIGLDAFRARTHHLAQYARARLVDLTGLEPIIPADQGWFTSMAHVPLPDGEARPLQKALWEHHGIEVPIIEFSNRRWIRVSCHLYTTKCDIDKLVAALRQLV